MRVGIGKKVAWCWLMLLDSPRHIGAVHLLKEEWIGRDMEIDYGVESAKSPVDKINIDPQGQIAFFQPQPFSNSVPL